MPVVTRHEFFLLFVISIHLFRVVPCNGGRWWLCPFLRCTWWLASATIRSADSNFNCTTEKTGTVSPCIFARFDFYPISLPFQFPIRWTWSVRSSGNIFSPHFKIILYNVTQYILQNVIHTCNIYYTMWYICTIYIIRCNINVQYICYIMWCICTIYIIQCNINVQYICYTMWYICTIYIIQ